uniref:Ricin B-type lectin domain-containing protein n=1 Tax=Macrostomum lignano TaxID=282301 RepID=A0A1I8FVT9_9PLAT
FEVIIDDKNVCNRYKDSTQFAYKTLKCDGYGHEIMVKSYLPQLTICEFEAYGKPLPKFKFVSCSQGSNQDDTNYMCNKAYDGKLDSDIGYLLNCAHTGKQNTWWKAKTDNPMLFMYVKIYNRDMLRERLTDFEVIIDDKNVCNRYKDSTQFAYKTLKCDGYGHEIMVKSYLPQLTICEFEAYGKPLQKFKFVSCSQGSNWDGTKHLCNKAYDGKLDTGKLGLLNCAHTGKENTWWKAKTEFPVRFICVKIYNREILKERLTNFDVIIDDKNVCNRYNKSWSRFATKILRCDGYGQEIMVKSRLPQLTICEFEAYGKALPKLKFDGCSQGSNADDAKHLCHEAFDSSLAQCAITNSDNTWWKAQTSQPVWFMFVKIFSRAKQRDSLTNFEVLIDENVCNRYKDSTEFDTKILPCGGYGHEIMVRSHLPKLAICEFEAYGKVLQKLKLVNCSQGSSLDGIKHSCDKAYDDKLDDPDNPIQNCAITNNDNTWWKAKTEHPVRFMYIKIYNRLTNRDTLTDFEVVIDETNVCNRYKDSTQFASKTLRCDASGQEIMVRSHLPKQLAICEIEAFGETLPMETEKLKLTNCSQGSDKFSSTSLCDRAYDNKLGDTLDHCALTNADNSWWRAQTEKPVRFIYVKIYNRLTKERQSRRTNLEVIIDEKKVCNRYTDSEYFLSKTLRCDGYGQEIMVKSNIPYLTLCEFEAYGESLPAEAEKLKLTNCSQGSDKFSSTSLCDRAYDNKLGDTLDHCALTNADNSWWRAQTEKPVRFIYVKIYNRLTKERQSRRTNLEVIIDEKKVCNRYTDSEYFLSKTLRCDGYGQEIMVKSNIPYLTLCEFEAYGESLPAEGKNKSV